MEGHQRAIMGQMTVEGIAESYFVNSIFIYLLNFIHFSIPKKKFIEIEKHFR